ncbi:MAG: formate dehydrogenase accessory sulfurtransferase FdhD [Gemmatimonadaceae bacterium]|nr:formate dehydrogenase accessory sulfurtransferase FdhD [Gemmatimonadaceae bacterium]
MTDPGEVRASGFLAPQTRFPVTFLDGDRATAGEAVVAEEVPVALAYNRRAHVVMMCTPSDLEDFAVGFTVSEGIARAEEISHLEVVRHRRGVEVLLDVPVAVSERLAGRARAISGRTGCGLCGVEAIDDAVRPAVAVTASLSIAPDALWRAAAALQEAQLLNQATRTVHGAAWAQADGTLQLVREDVGRHNALDKVLGALARGAIDATTGFAIVTSRASFELVQKAAACGVPLLAAVSRPTGLAIRMAEASGLTLVALVRDTSATVYAGGHRIVR